MRRTVVIGFVAFVAMPTLTTSACASSEESSFAPPFDAGHDVKSDHPGSGGTGGTGGTGGSKDSGSEAQGSGGTGTCNPATCPTPAPPATKCCVTANGPCGIDYAQGAGCQTPPTGDI